MKNILSLLLLAASLLSCKAQVIGTLEQFEECSRRLNYDQEGCPDLDNITYVKDTNNRLNQFVGTWVGSSSGKIYEVVLQKKIYYKDEPTDALSWDMIIGRMLIKDINGNVIYNSLSKSDKETNLFGYNFQNRVYMMHFTGNYDCLESGDVFIEIKLNNPNQMSLFYSQDKDGFLNPAKCPNFSTFVPLLPQQKMILTKQ